MKGLIYLNGYKGTVHYCALLPPLQRIEARIPNSGLVLVLVLVLVLGLGNVMERLSLDSRLGGGSQLTIFSLNFLNIGVKIMLNTENLPPSALEVS